jgi:isoquinoline 1-oxidoreductase subunit beta
VITHPALEANSLTPRQSREGPGRVRAVLNDLGARIFWSGWLRSIGPGWINWALESLMDDAAHRANVDPVAFRLRMLDGTGRNAGSPPYAVGGALRQANVLKRVAQKVGLGIRRSGWVTYWSLISSLSTV